MRLGEPDYAFDIDEVSLIVGRIWLGAKPGILLLNTWDRIFCRGQKEYRYDIALTRLTSNSDPEGLARDRLFYEWLKPHLEWHEGFVALNRRLAAIGITGRYSGFGEYVGQSELWSYRVGEQHLPALEEWAQDEAGFTTPEARREAAENSASTCAGTMTRIGRPIGRSFRRSTYRPTPCRPSTNRLI